MTTKREEAIYSLSGDSGFYMDQTEYLIDEVIAEACADLAARIIAAVEALPYEGAMPYSNVDRASVLDAIRKEAER